MKIKIRLTKEELDKLNNKPYEDFEFNRDNGYGKIGEKMSKQYFEQIGATVVRDSEKKNDLKKFDFEIEIAEKLQKVENKTDSWIIPDKTIENTETGLTYFVQGRDSGNIVVEFSSWGKDSGIVATESDIWVNFFHYFNEIWIISVSRLRKLIRENDFKIFYNMGQKNSQTHGYLIPREMFREHFKVVKYELEVI